ncbi:MAG: glycosyltransferase family 4 protein [Promethearchaeota archaeon]
MNISYFVHGFPPSIGAGSINAYAIAKFLSKYDHRITIFSPGVFSKISYESKDSIKKRLKELNINIRYSSKFAKIPLNLTVSHYENMIRYLTNKKLYSKSHIILSQYSAYHFASVVAGSISKIQNIPHVIRSHDIFFPTESFSLPLQVFHSILYTKIYRSILNCDVFYVTTTEMKRYYLKFKKLQNINFKIHHNGIDTALFNSNKEIEDLKKKYSAQNIIIFIGQISRDFDLKNVLTIMPELLKIHKDTHLLIIGDGSQPAKEFLLNFIKKKHLKKQIHFLGVKSHEQMPYYINNSDIGIGRITHERIWKYMIPVKCLEYMACKKPFITAPCSRDLIKNNDVGLMLNDNFIEKDIFEKFNILIEDNGLRRKLGEAGLMKINQKFRWEKLMEKFNNDLIQIALEN